jgi:hypothetical protein
MLDILVGMASLKVYRQEVNHLAVVAHHHLGHPLI